MNKILNDRGLKGSRLEATAGVFEGEALSSLLELMDRLENSLAILERRGVSLPHFIANANAAGELPTWHVRLESKESWFHTPEEVNAFRTTESTRLGRDLMVEDTEEVESGALSQFVADEYHEVRAINRALVKLRDLGFTVADLVPAPRIAGREPPIRYTMIHDDTRHILTNLREVVSEIRHFGEKGMTITRFKGLGEMDPEELWATTLDPQVRQLLQVSLVDALTANDLFRTLMGEEVEDRRNFIFDKGINVKDAIDYGS